jgi:hypothetical protein
MMNSMARLLSLKEQIKRLMVALWLIVLTGETLIKHTPILLLKNLKVMQFSVLNTMLRIGNI